MSGRGGRRTISFSVEAVGINRGESLPPSIQQPTPVYPVMEQKPLPLSGGEEAEYLLALKQEFRGAMRSLPHYIHPAVQRGDVERYSDKYHSSEPADTDWSPGVSAAGTHCTLQTEGQKKKKKKKEEEVLLTLETLQKKEQQSSEEEEEEEEGEEEEKKKKKKQDEEEAEAEEEYDEEEFEEETDYIMSYFDNGEEFGGDSDENMDEAVY
ncbi:RNA polymerase III subunit GL b isoform X3 [Eleginops maclovinus]|uniref:RNA polymerase III subunit GL b isoform X3 n=1 Tax=Eleginops maclovinus TaxID=56733 RepID=UPI00308085A8